MAVTNTTTIVSELGNGSKVAFDFSFKIFAETDLVIYKETAAGVFTQQTIVPDWGASPDPAPAANTCFVVFDTAAETGTVTFSEAPESGLASVIARATAKTQGSNLPAEEVWSRKVLENALDKLTLIVQEHEEKFARTPLQPLTPANPEGIIVEAPTDGKGLRWRYESGEGKWYIESTTYDPDDFAVAAAASADAAALSEAAAAASAIAAAASAAEAVDITTGLYGDKPAAPIKNIWYYSTDRDTLERYVVAAGRWFLIG